MSSHVSSRHLWDSNPRGPHHPNGHNTKQKYNHKTPPRRHSFEAKMKRIKQAAVKVRMAFMPPPTIPSGLDLLSELLAMNQLRYAQAPRHHRLSQSRPVDAVHTTTGEQHQ
jgi:hypothetical protein